MSDPRKNMETPWRNAELMERLAKRYRTQDEIALILETSRQTAGHWIRKHNLQKELKDDPWKNEKTLRNAYLEYGNQSDVAEEFGCSTKTIGTWMERHNIPVRKKHPSHPFYHKEKLLSLYEKHESIERVREELDCSPNHLLKWMKYHSIDRDWEHKDRGEKIEKACKYCGDVEIVYKSTTHQYNKWFCSQSCMGNWQSENMYGEKHPSYNGGVIRYGGDWTYYRDKVRFRDENTCQKCGSSEEKRIPDVHHIEPVRSFEDPHDAHFMENLIQLCRSCHHKIEKYDPDKQREILDLNYT